MGWISLPSLSDSPHGRGVSILFRSDLDIDILDHKFSIDGRRLLVNFNYKCQKYCIVNTYAPNNESARVDFFKTLCTWIPQNIVPNSLLVFLIVVLNR